MKAVLKAGAEVEFLTQAEMASELSKAVKAIKSAIGSRPRVRTLERTEVAVAGVPTTISLAEPATGMAWDVRRINITGQDPAVAVAGASAVVYRGEAGLPFSFVGALAALPGVLTFSSWQFTLRQEEELLVRIIGAGAGVGLFAVAQVLELPHGEVFSRRAET